MPPKRSARRAPEETAASARPRRNAERYEVNYHETPYRVHRETPNRAPRRRSVVQLRKTVGHLRPAGHKLSRRRTPSSSPSNIESSSTSSEESVGEQPAQEEPVERRAADQEPSDEDSNEGEANEEESDAEQSSEESDDTESDSSSISSFSYVDQRAVQLREGRHPYGFPDFLARPGGGVACFHCFVLGNRKSCRHHRL